MHLAPETAYLVLHDEPHGSKRKIHLVDNLNKAVAGWTPSSRISPLWAVNGYQTDSMAFAGDQTLIFLGPVRPARLTSEIDGLAGASMVGLWLSAGCFNVVLRIPDGDTHGPLAARITAWAMASGIAYETWRLSDGAIGEIDNHVLDSGEFHSLIEELARLIAKDDVALLRPAFEEFLIASATALARANAMAPSAFRSLKAVTEAGRKMVAIFQADKLDVLEMHARLLSMNAALSRFSSQAFSGIPPIQATECHFWIHSLLGTGSANLALESFAASLQHVLGNAMLPERLGLLVHNTDNVPSIMELSSDNALLGFDIIKTVPDTRLPAQDIVPLVTFFSGRDGFSSRLQTLSAPLATLAECNSYRSNLLTVTHEISHIFVQASLAYLSPTLGNETDIRNARRHLGSDYTATNQLEAAQQLFVEAVAGMEQAIRKLSTRKLLNELPDILQHWRQELQEIMVHSFDFLYFHQSDPTYYVTSIWHSWCSISGIADRVPHYLMRTLCAISATLLGEPAETRFPAALSATKTILAELRTRIEVPSNYVDHALSYIAKIEGDKTLFAQIEKEYSARLFLVRLVKIYLFSDTLAARLFSDPYVWSNEAKKTSKKERLNYDLHPIGNALAFLKNQLAENPNEAESIWVLHNLAFDLPSPATDLI